jgi:hypothetical protein
MENEFTDRTILPTGHCAGEKRGVQRLGSRGEVRNSCLRTSCHIARFGNYFSAHNAEIKITHAFTYR